MEEKEDLGSDHNLLWCEVECSGPKLVKEVKRYKWRVDGRADWNEYQSAIECEFMGWEEEVKLLLRIQSVLRWCGIAGRGKFCGQLARG